jgi:hypothetical protein
MNKEDAIKQLEEVILLFKRGINIRINMTDIKAMELLIKEVKNDKDK